MTSTQAYAIRAELAARLKESGHSLADLVLILRLHSKEDARRLLGRGRTLRRVRRGLEFAKDEAGFYTGPPENAQSAIAMVKSLTSSGGTNLYISRRFRNAVK